MNQYKKAFHENNGKPSKLIKFVKILKILTSEIFVYFCISLTTLIVGLIVFGTILFYFLYGGRINCIIPNQPGIVELPMFLLFIINATMGFIDLVLNCRNCCKNCKSFWIKQDPFFHRLQYIFLLILFISRFFQSFVLILQEIFNTLIVGLDENLIGMLNDIYSFISFSIDIIGFFADIIYFCGLLLFITILKKILNSFKRKEDFSIVTMDFLDDEELYKIFRKLCEEEYSLENLLCYEDIIKFEKLGEWKRKEAMESIFNLYVLDYAELEVNIPASVKKHLYSVKNSELNIIPADLFDELKKQATMNLSDTFSRMIVLKSYEALKRSRNFMMEEVSNKLLI